MVMEVVKTEQRRERERGRERQRERELMESHISY